MWEPAPSPVQERNSAGSDFAWVHGWEVTSAFEPVLEQSRKSGQPQLKLCKGWPVPPLLNEQKFRGANEYSAAHFGDRALALPSTQEPAGSKQPHISQRAEMLIGDVNLHSFGMGMAASMTEV